MTPYWENDGLTLYCGDALEILPSIDPVDAILTDPPYGETSLRWDRWQDGWPGAAMSAAKSMWCFGSLRMFMEHRAEFWGWRMSQDVIWEKHNGTNPHNDRFRRVHEIAAHFYQGSWSDIYRCPQTTNDATAKTVRRKRKPPQWGDIGGHHYRSEDGGPRLQTSVIFARSCHGSAIHPTQKPIEIILPLMEYAVPAEGLVLDCFAGSGVVLEAARKTGRRAIGIEACADHCAAIVDRLSQGELLAPAQTEREI